MIYTQNSTCLVPRGTSSTEAKSAIHTEMMSSGRYVDGVPVWFVGHVGPFTIYKYEIWY